MGWMTEFYSLERCGFAVPQNLGHSSLGGNDRMLVFTRKKEESLVIGSDIEVTILSIGNGNVKVGITAPRHIPVHRHEVFQSLKRQDCAANGHLPKNFRA
jgi:carbon storage regulator